MGSKVSGVLRAGGEIAPCRGARSDDRPAGTPRSREKPATKGGDCPWAPSLTVSAEAQSAPPRSQPFRTRPCWPGGVAGWKKQVRRVERAVTRSGPVSTPQLHHRSSSSEMVGQLRAARSSSLSRYCRRRRGSMLQSSRPRVVSFGRRGAGAHRRSTDMFELSWICQGNQFERAGSRPWSTRP